MTADSTEQTPPVAICVLSYDGATDLWPPFFDGLFAAWEGLSLPVYLVTNHKSFDGDPRVTSLSIGEDLDWSSNLIKALDRIPERHILFIFDDFFVRDVDTALAQRLMSRCAAEDWPYLTLHPNNYMQEAIEDGIRRISDHGVYRCTLVYAMCRKDFLLGLLRPGESAWDFEIEGGARARDVRLLSTSQRVFRHYHLLRKGKWMRPGYPILSRRYALDRTRPIETRIEYLLRESKEWLFRRYHRIMPPRLIEQRERRRKTSS